MMSPAGERRGRKTWRQEGDQELEAMIGRKSLDPHRNHALNLSKGWIANIGVRMLNISGA